MALPHLGSRDIVLSSSLCAGSTFMFVRSGIGLFRRVFRVFCLVDLGERKSR